MSILSSQLVLTARVRTHHSGLNLQRPQWMAPSNRLYVLLDVLGKNMALNDWPRQRRSEMFRAGINRKSHRLLGVLRYVRLSGSAIPRPISLHQHSHNAPRCTPPQSGDDVERLKMYSDLFEEVGRGGRSLLHGQISPRFLGLLFVC